MREITIRLPFLLPTRNVQDRMHFHEKRRLKDQIAGEFLAAGVRGTGVPIEFAEVTVWRHSTQCPDADGLYGSLKQILDVIQPQGEPRVVKGAPYGSLHIPNPGGLGLILNDDMRHIVLRPFWVKAKRGEQHTVIRIRELAAINQEAAA